MNPVRDGYKKRQYHFYLTIMLLLCLLIALTAVSMIYGNTIYSPKVIIQVLLGEKINGATFTIMSLRLPRTLAGLLCGFAFGIAGNTFQKLLKNPLASPDVIGVTAGNSIAAVFCILFLNQSGIFVSVIASISGFIVAALIYVISGSGENSFSSERFIMTGLGVCAFFNALISWMILKASPYDVSGAMRWLTGSLNGISLNQLPVLFVVVFLTSGLLLALFSHLTVLQLGTSYAVTLGMSVKFIRMLLIVLSVFLLAFATAVSGPIASVSFLSGPIAGKICGEGRTNLLSSGMTGSLLVVASDLLAQYAFPTRYPVGVITGILGAPYLIYLLILFHKKGESA